MHFQHQEANGAAPSSPPKFTSLSSTLPFGQLVPLSHISGPTYVTAQLLVQQIAYKLSDKIFSYSPPTFDLDVAAKDWASKGESNVHGYPTSVVPLQTRAGAGAFALGYIFSPDFDLSKRHIPQTLLAASGTLRHLRASLDQLSLLYGVSSPLVAHVAAVDYSAENGLVSEYDSALRIAEDLGLGLVSSFSTYETQHIALLATLMADLAPTLHLYDGVRMTRETLRVVDTLSETGIADLYSKISKQVVQLNQRLDISGKVVELVRIFNDELGTSYDLFEYSGHAQAETVLVVFGSTEAQLAGRVVGQLAEQGIKVGLVKVRVYRPFVEEAFLKVLPQSVRDIVVVGQVGSDSAVADSSVQSSLYGDVLASVAFSGKFASEPKVTESKYSVSAALNPSFFAQIVGKVTGTNVEAKASLQAHQFTFWDTDDSPSAGTPTAVGSLLAKESTDNVYVHETFDNLVQGGVVRTDIRSSKKSIEAPYHVDEADVVVIGEEKLLKDIAIHKSVKQDGNVIIKLANFKAEDVEKRLPAHFRKEIQEKDIDLYVLDASASPELESDPAASRLLLELAFIRVARPDISPDEISKLILAAGSQTSLQDWIALVNNSLHKIEAPASWAEIAEDVAEPALRNTVTPTGFVGFVKEEPEEELKLTNWEAAARGLAFKEAYGTQVGLRPDLTAKTSIITVKENRRLTPEEYDRHIFHIEFDLGDSGLTYKIGEALGIHGENDREEVEEFIQFYGLNPDELVQVPGRDDPSVLETRTVFQSLVHNVDILGKPPKRFYEALSEFATDEAEKAKLAILGSNAGAEEFKKRAEVDTVTYVDILKEFASARPSFHDLVRIVSPLHRREYSIASAQAVSPTTVALMIVVVNWVDPKGRKRLGHATRYLSKLRPGAKVTASVKPSVMKLPVADTAPLIMAGLGTGLAPFRAFVQYRAMQKAQGKEIGSILLYLGSRTQREEYLYGEEWEAYVDAGVITLLGAAFSRDQPQKIYIQDRMRQTMGDIIKAYVKDEGSFYLCGPTWPVPDVTEVLEEAIREEARVAGRKVDSRTEIEKLKDAGRYVLEVY
ncbi:related to MET10 - sulfite reductase flavin-binding subunit [Cephalotrichum gorgonifer]|uniref:assimilatory sulfite reductase (NADPH) n=1 Tax=Cephalotrichum gorgonifer TaxID=2041049 RepID=A0AAE8N4F8_9PEZI|nr:related to MET10 - sulfite reductase flavin-binding subunit [Cephalotrichum gorgonifer]